MYGHHGIDYLLSFFLVYLDELLGHLIERTLWPVSKPINDTSVENSWRRSSPVFKLRVIRIHGKDHMEISLDIFDKLLIDFFLIQISFLGSIKLLEFVDQIL